MARVEVTVRGGGIFGLAVAWEIARRGAKVRLIEAVRIGAGSSGGVVGALSPHVPESWNEKKAFQLASLLMAESWWAAVEQDGEESEDDYFVTWRTMIQWFSVRPEFTSSAFVQIGDYRSLHHLTPEDWPEGTESPGCVLPRLAVGLTHGGSLIGLFGYSVQT